MTQESKPSSVPVRAKQDGDMAGKARPPKTDGLSWVEPAVWTERMLAALEKGVKGGKWFSLMDKVYAKATLHAAYKKVAKNKGSAGTDRVTVQAFGEGLEANLERLHEQLRLDLFQPLPIRRTFIPKEGSKELRPLGIPTVRDRVVQTALRSVLEPIFERHFAENSYGFRPKRSCKQALSRVEQGLAKGRLWVVDADLKSYFDSIPHQQLMQRVQERVSDGRVLKLIEAYLQQQILDDLRSWSPEEGTPQGAVLSPLLANIYLDALDQLMAQQGFEMVRYADDFVVLCQDKASATQALTLISQWVQSAALTLHPSKTRLVDMGQPGAGFDFLGYHFARTRLGKLQQWPRRKSVLKLRAKLRVHTRRNKGWSLEAIILKLNPIVRGFFNYFNRCTAKSLNDLDGWLRMRLRSILRRRLGKRGRGRGIDHRLWPNAYFGELGLFSMSKARVELCQSPLG